MLKNITDNVTDKVREIIHSSSDQELCGQNINNMRKILVAQNKKPPINHTVIQTSFKLPDKPIIKWITNGQAIIKYSELPPIQLSKEQEKNKSEFIAKNKDQPKFYNGNHIVVEEVSFENNNTLSILAKKTDYATMAALPEVLKNKFKIGVIDVIITKDLQTILLQRNDGYKLWSSVSGFLEVKDQGELLKDISLKVAKDELIEELTGDQDGKEIDDTLIECVKLSSFSARGLHSSSDNPPVMPYHIDLMVTVQVNMPAEAFCEKYIKNNCAKDKEDHAISKTKVVNAVEYVELNHKIVDLKNLNSILKTLYSDDNGNFLYFPIVITALQAIGIDLVQQYEEVTKISHEELAIRLLKFQDILDKDTIKSQVFHYKIDKDTPEYEKIIDKISKEHQKLLKLVDPPLLKSKGGSQKPSWAQYIKDEQGVNTTRTISAQNRERCAYRGPLL